MVFTTEGVLEAAIESWPEWDLNPRPLNSVQTTEFSYVFSFQWNIALNSFIMRTYYISEMGNYLIFTPVPPPKSFPFQNPPEGMQGHQRPPSHLTSDKI